MFDHFVNKDAMREFVKSLPKSKYTISMAFLQSARLVTVKRDEVGLTTLFQHKSMLALVN